MYYLYVNKYVA